MLRNLIGAAAWPVVCLGPALGQTSSNQIGTALAMGWAAPRLGPDRYFGEQLRRQLHLLRRLRAGKRQPQQFQLLDRGLRAPRTYQVSVGLERQVNRSFRISTQYVSSRGVHLQRSHNINTPISGVYPFGDSQLRFLTEGTGFSRTNQLIVGLNFNFKGFKGFLLFGFYALSYGKGDAEGQPADPYNLRAEWGPSSLADVRHRTVVGTNFPMPWRLSPGPFLVASSGSPYNITTGRDANLDGLTQERPALVSGLSAAECSGGSLVFAAGLGYFNVNPVSGTAVIGRNYACGPANVTLNLRLARTWAFGSKGESGPAQSGPPPGVGGVRGGGPPPGGGPGGGGPGGPGGPPPGLFGATSGKKYNLTLNIMTRNVLNHPNYAAPSGDFSSPYCGEYRSLAAFGPFSGNTAYNRKIDLQLRFMF